MIRKLPFLTSLSVIIALSVVLFNVLSNKAWQNDGSVISGDAKVYYSYLPAIFIHDDLTFENLDPYFYGDHQLIWYNETPDGTRYIKGTYGMALMYSPFFFAGHWLADVLDEPKDGYSYPYTLCLSFAGLFYLLIGLIFLSKLLLRYFEDHVVATVLLITILGTNALYYFSVHMMYTHGPNFMLLSIMLYASMMWFDTHRWKWTVTIGVCGALLTLIRPIDIVFVFFLPLLRVNSLEALKARMQEIWRYRRHFVAIGVIFVAIFIPQFVYNYHISGKIFFYSYSGESFFFGNPNLLNTLFSYRNGWLIYSPLMIFALLGFIPLFKRKRKLAWYVLPAAAIYFYILASWWCWWYVGFGNRAFINLYPILALPLAAFVHYAFSKRGMISFAFKLVVLLGIVFSVFQNYQFQRGLIHYSDMTEKAYWDVFLKESPSQLYSTYLEPVAIERQQEGKNCVYATKVKDLNRVTYTFDSSQSIDSTLTRFWVKSKGEISVAAGEEFAGNIRMLPHEEANEIYLTAWVNEEGCEGTFISLQSEDQGYSHFSDEVVERKNGKALIHCYVKIPEDAQGKMVKVYFWNQNKKPFTCDELSVSFRKRIRYEKCKD